MTTKKKKRRSWTDAQKRTILRYANRNGVPAAAEHYDVHETSVYNWKRGATGTPRKYKQEANGASKPEAMLVLFHAGWSMKSIGLVFGTAEGDVEAVLREVLRTRR